MKSHGVAHATRRLALCALSSPLLLPALAPLALRAAPPDPASGVVSQSGLQYIDFQRGTGATPRFGQLIRFHYVGYALSDDAKKPLKAFDSSYERKVPYFTKHGNGYTCEGLEEALHSMRPGGQRRVVLPPALGFTGDKGPLPPGPNQRNQLYGAIDKQQPLVYDLELVSAVDDLLDRGEYDDLDLGEAQAFARTLSPPAANDGDGPMGRGL